MTACGVLRCSTDTRCTLSNTTLHSWWYARSRSVRRSACLKIPSEVWANSWTETKGKKKWKQKKKRNGNKSEDESMESNWKKTAVQLVVFTSATWNCWNWILARTKCSTKFMRTQFGRNLFYYCGEMENNKLLTNWSHISRNITFPD